MLRDVDLKEISDGKLYSSNDMVKTDCGGCQDCSACCQDMGTSILLDPLDIHRLSVGTGQSFEELMQGAVDLHVVDGIILPNLKMADPQKQCSFLDQQGRCSVHAFRPGICRIFPLGRFYDKDSFQYFLQIHECPKRNKGKIKIKKWIDIPNLKCYEKFISDWHYFTKNLQEYAMENIESPSVKTISMQVLQSFYMTPYDPEKDFYAQFYKRLEKYTG